MMIPWGSDAPLYHRPFATAGLILANVLVFAGQMSGAIDEDRFALWLGDGLHPVQWWTGLFLHGGVGHLVGNMLFLWVFGMIAEGKVGPWVFLALYLGIGGLESATEQILSLGMEEPSPALGASGAVFGLMAVCLVWAPFNEITVYIVYASFRLGVGTATWEAPIIALSLLYIGIEGFWLIVGGVAGLPAFSAFAHLTGALWGFVLATLWVKRRWVDCEGWDLYSAIRKRAGLAKDWKRRGERIERAKTQIKRQARAVQTPEDTPAQLSASATATVDTLLSDGQFEAAAAAIDRGARVNAGWPLRSELLGWIGQMHREAAHAESVPLMRMYCERFSEQSERVKLKLAQTYLKLNKAGAARRALDELSATPLPQELEAIRAQLETKARAMQEAGAYEIEGDD
jgi:membrane associated rhomboid family serine protease